MATLEDRPMDFYRITVAIEDPELGILKMALGKLNLYLEAGQIPPDVIVYCKHIDRHLNPPPASKGGL